MSRPTSGSSVLALALAVAIGAVLWTSPALAQSDAAPQDPDAPVMQTEPALEPAAPASPTDPNGPPSAALSERALLDGEVRQGAFLAGPGSLTFVLHHTLMGAGSGLVTQGIASDFRVDELGTRQRMLAGTLIGAGLGFGLSAWWQFNNWVDLPMANFGIVNSALTGLLMVGVMDLVTNNPLTLSWTAVVGAHAGAWLTATLAGGKMPMNQGLLISSGGLWGTIYSGLILAILGSTGTNIRAERAFDTMFISAGLGGIAAALATTQFSPTSAQILRASAFGLGVGGAVWVLSFLVVGLKTDVPTPHVLALLSSAVAITTVSLLWEEAAERPAVKTAGGNARYFYRSPELDRPYTTVWW